MSATSIGVGRLARADRLGRREIEAVNEDGQATQDLSLALTQQVVGPGDHRRQGLLARQGVATPSRQEPESLVEPVVEVRQRHRRQARRGEFDGERDAVEATTDRRHQASVRVLELEGPV